MYFEPEHQVHHNVGVSQDYVFHLWNVDDQSQLVQAALAENDIITGGWPDSHTDKLNDAIESAKNAAPSGF